MTAPAKRREREFISSRELRKLIREKVYAKVNPAELLDELDRNPDKVRRDLADLVDRIVAEEGYLLAGDTRQEMQAYILTEMFGLGPIDRFIKDPEVEEVMVNKVEEVWVARRIHGTVRLERTTARFDDEEHVMHVIDRIIGPIGRRVDESNPKVDARLKDGSRVNIVIPPLALDGPTITIRKFPEKYFTMDDMIHQFGTLTTEVADFLDACVHGRLNIVISGGTGSGKTTLLNALTSYIPDNERIITVEDTAELQVWRYKPHVVRLESRPPNIEGKGAVMIRDLVVNCLRMRPDRIVVGECRAGEAVDMLQAMNTGHDGSITTVHANSPRECRLRLESMFLMSGLEVPVSAIRQQIGTAIQLIVQLQRLQDGSRKVTAVAEVMGYEQESSQQGNVQMQDLFLLRDGRLTWTGKRMRHFSKIKTNLGTLPPLAIFVAGPMEEEPVNA